MGWLERRLLAMARRMTATVPMEFAIGSAPTQPGLPVIRKTVKRACAVSSA